MRVRHWLALIAVAIFSLSLSGCYVYALAPPASGTTAPDMRLVGTWYGIDEKGKPVPNAFLHFVVPKTGGPMRMISAENDEYGVFELYAVKIGSKQIFAVRKLPGDAAGGARMSGDDAKFLLGAYDVQNNTLLVRIYQPEKVGAAINAHRVKGSVDTGTSPPATLTGTPQEVARFLASSEADAALSKPFPFARRLPPPR